VTSSAAFFNGGTLQASASSADFISTVTICQIQSGGLVFDSQAFGLTNGSALGEDGSSPGGGLTKIGSGVLALTAANTYTGPTVVSNGTLLVHGSISGAATVKAGTTLGGNGTIGGVVTVEAGGTLAAGGSIGTLTLSASPALSAGATVVAELDRSSAPTADLITLGGVPMIYNGTLVVRNTGAPLQVGDTFTLFTGASGYSGSFTLVSQTPGQTVMWNTANLALDGTITVSAASDTPFNLGFSSSGGSINLSWPPSMLGLTLESNAVSVASPTDWFAVPGSDTVTNLNLTLEPTRTNVFFRLTYP
jgi:autotransporter-associated beta strand protein